MIEQQQKAPTREEHRYRYRRQYAIDCLPDSVMQANKLEALRYKWGRYRYATRVMQRLGYWGRYYWVFIAAMLSLIARLLW